MRDLSDDVRRYLKDEPVRACPPSTGYRLWKTTRRNKSLIATVALVLLTALIGTISSLRYAHQAAREAAEAASAQAEAEQQALMAENAWEHAQTLLYAADMKLASDAIGNGDLPRASELLERHIPQTREADRRGFEWHYLHKCVAAPAHIELKQGNWPNDLIVSPDGQWLACSIGDQGVVRIFDTATWQLRSTIQTGPVQNDGLSWSPDGGRIAAAGHDGIVRICNVERGEVEQTISAHQGETNDVAFGPRGSVLYTCGDDNVARQWDVGSGTERAVYEGHVRAIENLALNPDGSRLATACSDKSFAIYDTETGRRLHHYVTDRFAGRVSSVTFSPDGRLLAAANIYGKVFLTDVETGTTELLQRQLDGVENLQFFDAGRWLATADRGGGVQLLAVPDSLNHLNQTDRTTSLRWIAHEGRATLVTATPDGRLVSGGQDSSVRVWSPNPELTRWVVRPARLIDGHPMQRDIAVGYGNLLIVAGETLSIWNIAQRQLLRRFDPPGPLWNVVAAAAEVPLFAAARKGELLLLDASSSEPVTKWPLDPAKLPGELAVSPDGTTIILTYLFEDDVMIEFNRHAPAPIQHHRVSRSADCRYSRDGRWLTTAFGNSVRLVNLASGQVRDLSGHTNTVAATDFSPDGTLIASVSHDRSLKVWRPATGQLIFSIVAHRDHGQDVTFTRDGRTIITAGKDGQIKFWHTGTGQPLGTMTTEYCGVRKLQLTADGQQVAAKLRDHSVVVFDAGPTAVQRDPGRP